MAGKKQKRAGATVSLADALTATRAARGRVIALAQRLEETERTILAAMASAPAAKPATPATPATPAKRKVGRPPKAATAAPAKRPVGRPRTRAVGGRPPKA